MEIKKKYVSLAVISITFVLLIGVVLALTPHEEERYAEIDSFITKLKYGLEKGLFFFSAWGEINDCSVYPDKTFWLERGDSTSCSDYGYGKCAQDIWYDNTIYLGGATGPPDEPNWDNWLGENHPSTDCTGNDCDVTFSGIAYPWYFIEVYSCPLTPPEPEEHSTRVYTCDINRGWDSQGRYDIDEYCPHDTSGEDLCWCSDEDENFYVDLSGGVHCQPSSYSSVINGDWCSAYVAHATKDCVAGVTESLYWYDSLGERNDLIESCSSDERCTLNGCVLDDIGGGDDDELNFCSLLITSYLCNLNSNCEWNIFRCQEKDTGDDGDGDGDGGGTIGTRKSIGLESVNIASVITLLDSLCTRDNQCVGEASSCINIGALSPKYIDEDKRKNLREEACDIKYGNLLNDIGGSYKNACGIIETNKDEFFSSTYGTCISNPEELKTDMLSFFQWAALADITGDGIKDGTDGLLVVLIAFLIVLIITRK